MDNQIENGVQMDPFQSLPNEMQREIISFLPIKSILVARSVSSRWKAMISRNFTDFTCTITDESYPCLINSTEIFRTIKIRDLTGKGFKVVSSSRGAGRIIGDAERLELIGDNVENGILSKVLRYAVDLLELSFLRCTIPVMMHTAESAKHCFENLTTLRIQFKGTPHPEQTQFLNKLASLPEPNLQVLEHLSFNWSYQRGDSQLGFGRARARKIFANYVATMRVIIKVRKTLKSLDISRCPRIMVNMQIELRRFSTNDLQTAVLNEYVEQLNELKLDKLSMTLMMIEGKTPWILENAILYSQSSLTNLTLNKKCITHRGFLPQTLENLLPVNPILLTVINLSITIQGETPTSLSRFSQCRHLKTLWISFHCYLFSAENEWSCRVSELDQLPRTLESLRFMPQRPISEEKEFYEMDTIHQYLNFYRESYLILTQRQIEWITLNMNNLKFFACFLLAKETNEARVIDFGMFQIPVGEINEISNIDLKLFTDLVRMESIKILELNMLKAGQLRGYDEGVRRQLFSTVRSINELREYVNICREEEGVDLKTKVIPRKYVELTITKMG